MGLGAVRDPQATSFFCIIDINASSLHRFLPHTPLSNKAGKQTDTDCHDDELHQRLSHHHNRRHPHGIGQRESQRQNHQRVTPTPPMRAASLIVVGLLLLIVIVLALAGATALRSAQKHRPDPAASVAATKQAIEKGMGK